MTRNDLWSWLAVAVVAVLVLYWAVRYQYAACDVDGCIAINRWTGRIHFEPVAEEAAAVGEDAVLVRSRGRPASPAPAGVSWAAPAR
jgi:hypothetical protein